MATILEEIDCTDNSFKFGVDTAEYKSGRLLTQCNDLPLVFFHDLQVLTYQKLDKQEIRSAQGCSLNNYLAMTQLETIEFSTETADQIAITQIATLKAMHAL